jgi:hypothetical protein
MIRCFLFWSLRAPFCDPSFSERITPVGSRTEADQNFSSRVAMYGKMPYNIIYGMLGTGRKEWI